MKTKHAMILVIAITSLSLCAQQEGHRTFYIHHVTDEQMESINIRLQMNKLILETFADEEKGIHDIRKFRELKKLANELE